MSYFNVYRIFESGKNAGKKTKSPVETIEADSLEEAKVKFQGKKDKKYVFEEINENQLAGITIKSTNLSLDKKPSKKKSIDDWAVGDRTWFETSEWDPVILSGRIHEVRTSKSGEKFAVIWEDTNGSWRSIYMKHLIDKSKNPRSRKRKTIELTSKMEALTKPVSSIKRKT